MKKMNLLLILPLTAAMAINFTMTKEGLFTETTPQPSTTTQPTASEVSNSYLEPVNIPTYDSSNPSHLLITASNGKWTSANLNNATYKHFYVGPGDYSNSIITLTADGTSEDRRSISLYNGNDTHPASLTDAQQADIKIKFNDADYWDIDRMSGLSYQAETDREWLYNGSSYNTFNRHHLKDYYYGIIIRHDCNYNTIQRSYINHMTHEGRLSDNVGIVLAATDFGEGGFIIGTKVIECDIRNAGDGIQLVVSGTIMEMSYEGTIVDNNNIWNDGDVYTNGDYNTNGYNPDGQYQIGENAMDLKRGSSNSNNPVIITNNRMWGYQAGDGTAGGSQTTGRGGAFPIHYGVYNTKINNNIIFDSMQTITISNSEFGDSSFGDSEIKNNIFYHIDHVNPEKSTTYAMYLYDGGNVQIENNSYIDINIVNSGYYMRFENTVRTCTFKNNVVVNTDRSSGADGNTIDNTWFYNATDSFNGTNEHSYSTKTEANMADYTFQYERFTASPKSKTLTGVISTRNSPHYGIAGSSITGN